MLKNCSGFSVIEVLSSFAIFLVLVTFLVPMLIKIYEERTVIDYKKKALVLLHNEKESFLYDGDYSSGKEIITDTRKYQVTIGNDGVLTQLCVSWEVPWKKKGKVCEYAKK